MKKTFLNYIEYLKTSHFFLLIAIISSFLHATIQITLLLHHIATSNNNSFADTIKSLFPLILIFISPFILVWVISYLASINPIKIKALDVTITFLLNSFIIVVIQGIVGYFVIIFMLVF